MREGRREAWVVAVVAAMCCGGAVVSGLVFLGSRCVGRRSREVEKEEGYVGMVGGTPMVRLSSLSDALGCEILVKVESLNPGMTGKDRIALNMIREAEEAGRLAKGGLVVEGTSGSTGISLACLCKARGYKCTIVMPDDQAEEKVSLLKLLGASVVKVRTAAIASPDHYVNVARRIAECTPGATFMNQFETISNYNAHLRTTGPEIWEQCRGSLDAFVMGAGTGGTIAGVATYLDRVTNLTGRFISLLKWGIWPTRHVRIVLVDPPGSSLLNRVKHGVCYADQQAERKMRRHRYDTIAEGIGLDRITANFGRARIDDAIFVDDQTAVNMAHYLLQNEGLLVGCSSAMNCVGAARIARELGPGHTVVTVLCDHGSRYMSRFWNEEFISSRGLQWPDQGALDRGQLEAWL